MDRRRIFSARTQMHWSYQFIGLEIGYYVLGLRYLLFMIMARCPQIFQDSLSTDSSRVIVHYANGWVCENLISLGSFHLFRRPCQGDPPAIVCCYLKRISDNSWIKEISSPLIQSLRRVIQVASKAYLTRFPRHLPTRDREHEIPL